MTGNTRLRVGEIIRDSLNGKDVFYLVQDGKILSSGQPLFLLAELSRLSNGIQVSFVLKPKGFVRWMTVTALVEHFRYGRRA